MLAKLIDRIHRALGRSDIYFHGDLYMRRWRVGPQGGIGIRLHHIVRSDIDRELHDHPFTFVSIILAGGYTEHRVDGSTTHYPPGSVLFRRAETLHRLTLDRPAWTLVIRGPLRRVWGFATDHGWVPWTEFVAGKGNTAVEPKPFAASSSI